MRVMVAGDEKRSIVIDVFLRGLLSKYGEDFYLLYRHDDEVGKLAEKWIDDNKRRRYAQNIEWTEKYEWELDEPKLAFFFGNENYDLVNSLGDTPMFRVEKLG